MSNVDVILNQLGWQDGFRIPVANEANKHLEEEIIYKTQLKIALNTKLDDLQDRQKMMRKHASDVFAQHEFNQKLLSEHSAQLETEDHLYRLSGNMESALRQETREFDREWTEVNQRVSNVEKELLRMLSKLAEAKRTIKFDEDSLRKWEEKLTQKEEDNQLIEDYMKQDTQKYKELEQERQKLSMELENYRRAAMKIVDEAQEMELVLDSTTKLYAEALKERRQMINQWTQSVNVLRQRDHDIQNCLRELEMLREISREKKSKFEEAEKFLNDQILDNKELQRSIKQLEKKLAAILERHRSITVSIGTYSVEVLVQKKLVAELSRRIQQTRVNVKNKRIDIENKRMKVENCKQQIEDLTITLEEVEDQKLNVEEKTKRLEKMMEYDEKRKSIIIKELHRLQAASLRTLNKIIELKNERKIMEMQIENEQRKIDLFAGLIIKERKNLDKKETDLYQVEFSIQKCEMKLERLRRGQERDKAEIERKQKRIDELQVSLDEKIATSKLLHSQVINLEQDMKKISTALSLENVELERLKNKKQDLLLLIDGGEKRLKTAQFRNEEKQVEENIMRLRVSHLERIMSNVNDKVYDLEKYRLHLEAALKERTAEIAAQKEALIVQKRIAGADCSDLRVAIAERKGRVRQLQARYDSGIASLGKLPDGTPMSTAYMKIQNAQERYMLREHGDKLDETIKRTEQEIQVMENTLRVVNVCNDKYKDSMSIVDEDGPEHTEQKILDEQMYNARQNLRERETQLRGLADELQKTQDEYTILLDDIERAKQEKENKQRYLSDLGKQITEQTQKLCRADRDLRKAQKDVHNLYICRRDDTLLLQQKEVELRELQEQNALVLQDIAEFTIRHMEVEGYVKKLLRMKNIELPCFSPSIKSPVSPNGEESSANSVDRSSRSTSRVSGTFASSKESISTVVTIEPQFEELSSNPLGKTTRNYLRPAKIAFKRSGIAASDKQSGKKP